MRKYVVPALVLTLVQNGVLAQDLAHQAVSLKSSRPATLTPRASDSNSDCPADVPQRQIVECMKQENTAIDKAIDARIKLVASEVTNADISSDDQARFREKLMASQRSWLAFRQVACDADFVYFGGADASKLTYLDCMRRHAQSRLQDLDAYLPEVPADE